MKTKNIFKQLPAEMNEELFENILTNDSCRLERIISKGHATPQGQWYDQEVDEWVLLLKGSAGLRIEQQQTITMQQGDYILLPAGLKHRVEWTAADTETIWLALHFSK